MSFQVMGINEKQAHMVEVHRGGDTRVLLKHRPCALHVFGIMDIIDSDDAFLGHTRQEIIGITEGSLAGMIGIDIGEVDEGFSISD